MRILCGDIGGTNSRLLVADVVGTSINSIVEKHYPSHDFACFDDVLKIFLQEIQSVPESACFAIAGLVKQGAAKITNLPWHLHQAKLKKKFSFTHVALINDFTAIAYGVAALQASDYKIIQPGKLDMEAPRVIVGAGTGLGVAQSIYHAGQWHVMASEGGHMAFSPVTATQRDFLQWMSNQQAHVSNEDVLSGKGLVNLYRFYANRSNQIDAEAVRQVLALDDPPAAISQSATAGNDAIAVAAVNQFIEIYGALAGDLALLSLAFGGVYIAGGIAPKIADQLCSDAFLQAFYKKGPMTKQMSQFPVRIIMNERVGLMGAALCAAQSAH